MMMIFRKALAVQILLSIARVDLAEKVLASMTDIDDDDPITTLTTAWVYISQVSYPV